MNEDFIIPNKQWICDETKLAQDLSVVRDGTNSYRIRLLKFLKQEYTSYSTYNY